MGNKVIKSGGFIAVTKTILGQETKKREKIKVRPFVTEPMVVGAKFGGTVNLGNYENAKIDVYVQAPCYVEEAPQMLKQVCKMAEDQANKLLDKIKNV